LLLVSKGSSYVELRSAAFATVEHPELGTFSLCATHLDHRDEQARLEQWEGLVSSLEGEEFVVAGDFNALNRGDYSEEEWAEIDGGRAQEDWEPARSELMTRLLERCRFFGT
jgi:endonuclease/exonuclease/phosphatase family metal-dependent hydrolase